MRIPNALVALSVLTLGIAAACSPSAQSEPLPDSSLGLQLLVEGKLEDALLQLDAEVHAAAQAGPDGRGARHRDLILGQLVATAQVAHWRLAACVADVLKDEEPAVQAEDMSYVIGRAIRAGHQGAALEALYLCQERWPDDPGLDEARTYALEESGVWEEHRMRSTISSNGRPTISGCYCCY